MILDAGKYRFQMPYIIGLTKDKSPEDLHYMIGMLSIASGVPIIIVAYYLIELYGFNKEIYDFIERLKKFYGVTEVINL